SAIAASRGVSCARIASRWVSCSGVTIAFRGCSGAGLAESTVGAGAGATVAELEAGVLGPAATLSATGTAIGATAGAAAGAGAGGGVAVGGGVEERFAAIEASHTWIDGIICSMRPQMFG